MIKFKKLPILALIVPVLISGVLIAACFCPTAQAAFVDQISIQKDHHCCCPDTIQPTQSSVSGEVALFQAIFSQKILTGFLLIADFVSPVAFDSPVLNFKPSDFKLSKQDIFLKNEVLRL